jgi:hypothetical protein
MGEVSSLASCSQPLDGFARCDDWDVLETAQRQQVALLTRGDEIGLAGHCRSDDVIVVGIGGHDAFIFHAALFGAESPPKIEYLNRQPPNSKKRLALAMSTGGQ